MRNKKHIKLAVIISICVIAVLYVSSYLYINSVFPEGETVIYKQGEMLSYLGADVVIDDAEFIQKQEIEKSPELMDIMAVEKDEEMDYKIAVVDITVTNNTDSTLKLSLEYLNLCSIEWAAVIDLETMYYYNGAGVGVELKKGESKQLKLPYSLMELHFSDNTWEQVQDRDYYMVYSLYPVKNMGEVKFR